ncbi:MAG TPA: hypothetical protein DCX22_01295 [Dehalococcoidia bacterium]|nr:hypothetical protein [Dehalococcoidia bacterium]
MVSCSKIKTNKCGKMSKQFVFFRMTLLLLLLISGSMLVISCDTPEQKHQKQANNYYDEALWDNAIAEYGEVLKINPKNTEALVNRGSSYTEKGEYDLAIADCTQAIEIDPENVIAYYNRSIAYLRRGDLYKAQGNDAQAKADWELAIKDCSEIIDSGLQNSFVLLHRGLAYKNLKDYNAAEADLNKAMTTSTNEEFILRVKLSLDQMKQEQETPQK